VRRGHRGRVEIDVARRELEGRGHDADDGKRIAAPASDAECFPDHIGVPVETALPEGVADENGVGAAPALFGGRECAAKGGRDAQGFKEARGDEHFGDLFGESAGGFGEIVEVVATDGLEGGVEAIPIFETRRGNETVGVAALHVVLGDLDQLIGVGERQGTQDDGIDGGEDRAVGSDAQGKRENDGQRERRRFAQEAQSGAEVEEERVGECRGVDFADGLSDLFGAAEFKESMAVRPVRRFALIDVRAGELVDVVSHLAVDGIVGGVCGARVAIGF